MRWGGGAAGADAAGCSWAASRAGATRGSERCCSAARVDVAEAAGGDAESLARLPSPSPPRTSSSECGLTASALLCEVEVQAEISPQRGSGPTGIGSVRLRSLVKDELQERKSLANACGSELCCLLASALRREAAARAVGSASLRARVAAAGGIAVSAQAALLEAERERDSARERLQQAAALQHAAQRRHAGSALRLEQQEARGAHLRQTLQALGEEHAAVLRRCEEQQCALQTLRQRSAEQEERAAADAAALHSTVARLRGELEDAAERCRLYEQERARRRECESLPAAEAAGREALGRRLGGAMQLLCSEHLERGRAITNEAALRRQHCHNLKYTGPAAEVADRMPAHQALMVNLVCHSVAVFVPEDWAPVCSTAARASYSVMRVHRMGWSEGLSMLGPFQSKGRICIADNELYGPEPGPLHGAMLDVKSLWMDVNRTPGTWTRWRNRWVCYLEGLGNLYEHMQIRYTEAWLSCLHLRNKATRATNRIEQALTMRAERTEAEGGEE
eukprot:TRINITY_DN5553_c0_g1_i7.p1 TRINITY_DN5553_c0_g1~~TRINITY_DN5553_c0_g1_i7.p1  ORF type:complete len:508 (+),score=124.14 TRINITY_DN5553_c0_g1_i7:95-1618(+)